MAYGRISNVEKLLTYGVLTAGALVFAFPFLWMVGTSVKVRREMAAAELRVTPLAPRVRDRSPYVDTAEFGAPAIPDGVPREVWRRARPNLAALIQARLRAWQPALPNTTPAVQDAAVQSESFRDEMMEGVFETVALRLSDDARNAASEHQREAGGVSGDTALSPAAIAAGAAAVEAAAATLVDARLFEDVFDQCFRRFCLGECRIRSSDYRIHSLYSGTEWRVVDGSAALHRCTERDAAFQQATFQLDRTAHTAAFACTVDPPLDPAQIDRVFVTYRGDAGWARLVFEVVREGQVFRTQEMQNLYERDWVEAELRWPVAKDVTERRSYLHLRPVGTAPAGAPRFAVRVILERNTPFRAWTDKILRNYRTVFREVPFVRYIMTSLALSILSIVLTVFSCTLTGYAFARLEWPGRDLFFGIMLATMMIPAQVTMIPGFLIIRHLGWYNTLLPLWVFHAFGGAFFTFLLRQFFKSIPADLQDAARIDGCGFLRVYWHVMLPLVRPTIATIAIYTFMGVWNNFMGPLIYVNDERLFPLALGLFKFSLRSGTDVGLMMAGSFLMTLPILVLFFFLQRYFIQGISLTGMKG